MDAIDVKYQEDGISLFKSAQFSIYVFFLAELVPFLRWLLELVRIRFLRYACYCLWVIAVLAVFYQIYFILLKSEAKYTFQYGPYSIIGLIVCIVLLSTFRAVFSPLFFRALPKFIYISHIITRTCQK